MMMTSYSALVVMLILVVLTKIPAAIAQYRSNPKGYDNRHPRAQQSQLKGWGARALASHQNTFEALIIFTAALTAYKFGGGSDDASHLSMLVTAHTVARIVYPILYIADLHVFRSLVWGVGFFSSVWIALLPI